MEKTKGHITFNEKYHRYTNGDGDIYPSVTTKLKEFTVPFIATKDKTRKTREALNLTHEEVLDLWQRINENSKRRGSYIHFQIETYLKKKPLVEPVSYEEILWNTEIPYDYFFSLRKRRCKPHIEDILWDDILRLAGQSDAVLEFKNHLEILDWKTNAKIDLTKSYNKMLPPFEKYDQSSYMDYVIQLTIYSIFAEKYYKKPVKSLTLVHIYKELENGYKIITIPKKLVKEVKQILIKHWGLC